MIECAQLAIKVFRHIFFLTTGENVSELLLQEAGIDIEVRSTQHVPTTQAIVLHLQRHPELSLHATQAGSSLPIFSTQMASDIDLNSVGRWAGDITSRVLLYIDFDLRAGSMPVLAETVGPQLCPDPDTPQPSEQMRHLYKTCSANIVL